MKRALIPVLIVLAAILATGPASDGSFVYDDEYYVLRNPAVHGETSAWSSGLGEADQALWRPVTVWSWATQWTDPPSARPFHLVDIALHALISLLVWLLARQWLARDGAAPAWGAAVAGLLFAVHPVHAEPVAWISARSELLATLFVLAAWLAHMSRTSHRVRREDATGAAGQGESALSARRRGNTPSSTESGVRRSHAVPDAAAAELGEKSGTARNPRAALLAPLLVLAAGLCKESALLAPLLFLVADLGLRRRPLPWRRLATLALVAAAVWACRMAVLPNAIPTEAPFSDTTLGTRVVVASNVLARALALMAWPHPLKIHYHRSELNLPDLSHLVLLGVWAVTTLWAWRRLRPAGVALALIPVSLGTVLNLVPIGATFAVRFLYLPSLFACLAIGALVAALYRSEAASGRGLGVALVGPLLLVAAAIPVCRAEVGVFRTDLSLWKHTAQAAPDNPHARYNHGYYLDLAEIHVPRGPDRPSSGDELWASLLLDPGHLYAGFAHQTLGKQALFAQGRWISDTHAAAHHFREAARLMWNHPAMRWQADPFVNLAQVALADPDAATPQEARAKIRAYLAALADPTYRQALAERPGLAVPAETIALLESLDAQLSEALADSTGTSSEEGS